MQAVSVSIPGSSFSSRQCGRSVSTVTGEASSSGCNSLAPYWIPEEVKHYFVHHHSEAAKKSSNSRITDKALFEIGLERELSTGDGSHWPKWRDLWARLPRPTYRMFLALTTFVLSVVLLVGVITEYRLGMLDQLPGLPTLVSLKNEFLGTGGPPAIADKNNGNFPLPVRQDKGRVKKEFQDVTDAGQHGGNRDEAIVSPHDVTNQDDIAIKDNFWISDKEMAVNTNYFRGKKVKEISDSAWAILKGPITKEACRTTPVFTLCSRGSPEFFYDHSRKACVATSSKRLGVCNRGPNRFSSWDSCLRRCVVNGATAAECHGGAVFAECQARDIVRTWWYLDGKRCRRWPFPNGRCPAGGKDAVFRTSAECVRRCLPRTRHHQCRPPKPITCDPKHLRFAFYADASARAHPARRCRKFSASAESTHYCLAGSNRFKTLSACRKTCLRGHAPDNTNV